MKNPSDPSLMGSLTSYIERLPSSLSNIQHNSHMLMEINTSDTTSAKKAIKFEVEFETKRENKIILIIGIATIAIFAV